MRWLTREWWNGDMVGPEYEAATLHHALNLERIFPSLPLPLRVLAEIDLHDALLDEVTVDEEEGHVAMTPTRERKRHPAFVRFQRARGREP